MKVCPQCDQTFNDDNLMFCLLDGSPLVSTESQPTIVIERALTSPKKKNTGLWVGLVVVVMLFGIVAVAVLLMIIYGGRGDVANGNRQVAANTSPTKAPATPRSTPSQTPASSPVGEPSPKVGETKPTPKNDESDEINPIAWNTSAATFNTDVGKTYKFQCPENGTESAIWGSDIYTADSSICTAAVHAGLITLEGGGVVTIQFRPGRSVYGSTLRNGITSNTFGEYPHSFIVK